MASNSQPLIIKDWQQGIADSPHLGIGLLRNVDIESFPGAVKVSKQPTTCFLYGNTVTFTADSTTDICSASGAVEQNNASFSGMAVYFTTTGTLPAGLTTGTVYFLIYVSGNTFKVSTSYKNSAGSATGTNIDITNNGSGTHTMVPVAIGTINWIQRETPTGYSFMIDSNGRVWFYIDGTFAYLILNAAIDNGSGSVTNGNGYGLCLFRTSDSSKLYLFAFRNAVIDIIDVSGNSFIEADSWTNGWKSLNAGAGSSDSHNAIVGQDNLIYFCDNRYLGSIQEIPGKVFAPADSTTYNYNNQALTLPQGEVAQCLEELGKNLLIGGNIYNKIYPWDRVSNSFNLPLLSPEFGIKRMKNIGNTVFILSGTWGNIYTTQGSYVRFIKKVPLYITNNGTSVISNPITWGGISAVNGALLFGVGSTTTPSASGVFLLYPDGIYNINGRLVQDNTPSTGAKNVTAFYSFNYGYIMGYAGGMDNFNIGNLYQTYQSVIHTALYRVGNKTQKTKYTEIEVQIAKPASNGSIRIKWRSDESSTFQDIPSGAVTYTCDGIATSFHSDAGITDIENIQLQIELAGQAELMEVRLFP